MGSPVLPGQKGVFPSLPLALLGLQMFTEPSLLVVAMGSGELFPSGLTLNHNHPDLYLPSSWDCRHESPCLSFSSFFFGGREMGVLDSRAQWSFCLSLSKSWVRSCVSPHLATPPFSKVSNRTQKGNKGNRQVLLLKNPGQCASTSPAGKAASVCCNVCLWLPRGSCPLCLFSRASLAKLLLRSRCLQQQELTFLQLWRLEIQGQWVSRIGSWLADGQLLLMSLHLGHFLSL
jgi:hypothetical protein